MDEASDAVEVDSRSSVSIEDVAASIPKGSPKVSAKVYWDNGVPGAREGAIADVLDTYNRLTLATRALFPADRHD